MTDRSTPPVADTRQHSFTHHGITIEDPWHWLRDQNYPTVEDPDVLAYLKAENEYFDAVMSPHKELTDALFEEIKGREQPDLSSVPSKSDEWYYQWRFEEGSQYRVWLRWPVDGPNAREAPTADARTILDEPALAKDHEYFRLGSMSVSNNGSLLAYSTETDGSERFRMVVKNLDTGEMLEDEVENTVGGAVWASDDASFLYTLVDENWRPWQVRLHILGEPVEQDTVVYEEPDPGFFVSVWSTTSEEYIVIGSGDHVTSEVRLLRASDPGAEPVLVSPRRTDHEYSVDHQGDRFVIRTNDTHKNSRLATAPEYDPTEKSWMPLVDALDSHYIRGFAAFKDFITVQERIDGLDHVRLIDRAGESTYIPFPESAYTAHMGNNPEFQTDTLRLGYSSMVTPDTVFDYHLDTEELEVRKVQQIPSGYEASAYVTERILANARDGVQVPVSLVRCEDTPNGWHCTAVPVRLRRVRSGYPAGVFNVDTVAVGPRLCLRHRAHSRRRRPGIPLVRGRQAGQAHQRVQRLRGRRAVPYPEGIQRGRENRHIWRQRRWAAGWRRVEPGPGAMGNRRRSRPIRGHVEYNPG